MNSDFFDGKDIFVSDGYQDFKKKLRSSSCSKCPNLCQDRHNIVVDRGNAKAEIVAIGEAPGQKEDLQGESFVGRAGKMLDQIMASVGLDTNKHMLILNVVKCRPPKNRPPKPEEAKNCFPYLEWQLKQVKPKVVVLLGATAAKYFLPKKKNASMKDLVGNFFDVSEFPGTKFQLLYHPAYLLRDPRKKPIALEHVKALKTFLESEKLQFALN